MNKIHTTDPEDLSDTDLDCSILELLGIEKVIETDETSQFDPKGRFSVGSDCYIKDVTNYYWKDNLVYIEDLSYYGSSFSKNEYANDWLISIICDPSEDSSDHKLGLKDIFINKIMKTFDNLQTVSQALWYGLLVSNRDKAEVAYLCLLDRKLSINR